MEENQQFFSASELDRLAGLQPIERRRLIRQGFLKPSRTGAGWAIYTKDDVARAGEWKRTRLARASKPTWQQLHQAWLDYDCAVRDALADDLNPPEPDYEDDL